MLNLVVDTQVFWRGIVKISDLKTLNAKFINLWLNEKYLLLVSNEISSEYLKAPLVNPKFASMLNITERSLMLVNALIKREAKLIIVKSKVNICRDPKDNMFLECAIDGKADYIITADNDLLELNEFKKIKIITVPEIMKIL